MRTVLSSALIVLVILAAAVPAGAADPQPPKGFTALFNGKDLTGWHGMPHFDPYKLAAMPEDERKAQIAKWTEDAKKHWTVENGELVNDGNGAYLTTDKEYGDIELLIDYKTVAEGRQRHLSAGHAAGADLGLHQGRRQVGPRRRQGLRRPVEQQPRTPPARTRSSWPTSRSASGTASASSRSASASPSTSTTSSSSITPAWRTSGTASCRCSRKGPIQLQTHGGEIRWRNIFIREIPAAEANAILRKHGADGLRGRLQRQGLHRLGRARSTTTRSRTAPSSASRRRAATIYTKEEYADFVARLEYQAAARRQQRPGDPLSRQGRHRLRRHVRAADPRRRRAEVRQARPAAVQRLGLRHGRRPTAATCGRSASGTSRK